MAKTFGEFKNSNYQNQHSEEDEKKLQRLKELEALQPIDFETLENIFNKWMLIPDQGILKFIAAFYAANKLSRRALWAIIIAPSGGGKTELLNSLLDLPDIYEISLLTPNTFLSGMPGAKDSSLLPKLNDKIMLFKDWTSILSLQRDTKSEIMSQFREIWDGRMTKEFGNGRSRNWSGKVSLLAASTQAVDMNQQQFTHLGERFINYRLLMPDRKEAALKSLNNDADQELMHLELKNAMYSFMKGIDFENLKELPQLDEQVKSELVNLANFCTMARSGVIRDFGFRKEVIFVPTAEMPTRIAQQLNVLGSGLTIINKGKDLSEKDINILYKSALDSIPQTNRMVMLEMARGDNQTTAEIATALGYPTEPIRVYLENLAMLKVCKRVKEMGNADRWTLNEEFADILRNYEEIEMLTEQEIESRKIENEEAQTEELLDSIPDDM